MNLKRLCCSVTKTVYFWLHSLCHRGSLCYCTSPCLNSLSKFTGSLFFFFFPFSFFKIMEKKKCKFWTVLFSVRISSQLCVTGEKLRMYGKDFPIWWWLLAFESRHTHSKITEKLNGYNGMLAFVTCLKNGFIDFAQVLLVAVDLC